MLWSLPRWTVHEGHVCLLMQSTPALQFTDVISETHTKEALKITYLLCLSLPGLDSRYCLAKFFSWDLSRLKSIKLLARQHSFLNFRCFFQVYVFVYRTQLLTAVGLISLLFSLLPDLGLHLRAGAHPTTTTKCWGKYLQYHNLISH